MSQVAHQARAYPSFLSMKGLRIFLLGMLVHHRVTSSIKFAGTHLYTWVERGTVRVKCLAQEHNTMSPARARTRTTRSRDKRTNHDATIGFCGRRKTGEPGEKQGKNQQHTQPHTMYTCMAPDWNQGWATLVEGKFPHHFIIPAPRDGATLQLILL